MKILTPRNNKDYYDYLTGSYGIDEKVVYDRRQFNILKTLDSPFFSYSLLDNDSRKKEIRTTEWVGQHRKRVIKLVAAEMHCMLEVGLKWYFFKIERYLDDSDNVNIDWAIIKTKEISKHQHIGSTPMSFFTAYYVYGSWRKDDLDIRVEKPSSISNPILTGTPITSFIPPEEIYANLYSYISSLNDVEFTDTRTDVQKAESAGFDKKTSFRNIK